MISRALRWQDLLALFVDFASGLGFLTIITAIADFFFSDLDKTLKTPSAFIAAILVCVAYAVIKNWPRNSFISKIANRDVCIELRIGDISKYKGSIVVPVNTSFDFHLNGSVEVAKSVKARIIRKFFKNDHSILSGKVKQKLRSAIYSTQRDGQKYKIGTTVLVPADNKPDSPFYFVANSHRNADGARVEAHETDLTETLSGLWSYISEHGTKGDIGIPLLGTGHGRLSMTREDVYKEIVRSFVASCAGKVYCNKLTIFIRPEDIDQHRMAIRDLVDFTRLQSLYADFSAPTNIRTGNPANGE